MQNEKATLVNDSIMCQWTQSGLLEFSHRMIFQPMTFALFGEIDPHSLETDFRLFDDKIHYFGAILPTWMYSWFFTKALTARTRLNSAWLAKLHPSQESELSHARTVLIQDNYNWLSGQDHGALQTTLLWGALGNTIPTVFWCLFHILQNAEALEVIKQEIDEHLPFSSLDNDKADSVIEEWTVEKLNSCVYLESAINETLRFAASTFLTRKCRQETQILLQDGRILNVKPNETVAYFAPITHLDADLFPDPNKFVFDRFVNKNADNIAGFLPFGSGKSICPGRFFAKNDIKICFAMLLRRYMEFKFIDTEITTAQKRGRVGFGVAPPSLDVKIMYRYKM
ncbi:unnamed protein product [Didymodactylos carnosus]|uniref:Cytochrome P450 n=1 Tax=Didymodactylos carnosus TaxID=1234261 RepID=A0A816BSC7_9BILA|nr:unnamed protein product [Didymodactylos carnosus]CAF1613499.1 unnamed protein product [Didymodactylos carnosus]CAF3815103.1 unnamed protein product [Didymodactylos carnosus]CAF4498404.1 unnamed protein product [Didymodactylos carnosus]